MPKREQVSKQKAHSKKKEVSVEGVPVKKVDAKKLAQEMDAILDEIDSVLEENAQEFVEGYVQKGGE